MDINIAETRLEKKGFLDIEVNPALDLFLEIEKLKKEKMQLYWPIITRSPIYRMLLIL